MNHTLDLYVKWFHSSEKKCLFYSKWLFYCNVKGVIENTNKPELQNHLSYRGLTYILEVSRENSRLS